MRRGNDVGLGLLIVFKNHREAGVVFAVYIEGYAAAVSVFAAGRQAQQAETLRAIFNLFDVNVVPPRLSSAYGGE